MLWVTGLNFEFTLYGSTYWDLKSNLKEKKKITNIIFQLIDDEKKQLNLCFLVMETPLISHDDVKLVTFDH